MKQETLDTLKALVQSHPEIVDHLHGSARWFGEVYACKLGEAPDDAERRRQERQLLRKLTSYLEEQRRRVIQQVRELFGAKALQLSFWQNENQRLWSEMAEDFVGILVSATRSGLNLLDEGLGQIVDEVQIRQNLIEYASRYRDKWLRFIGETSRDFVEKTILDWQQSGNKLDDLIQALSNPDLGMFNKFRAELIAITETTRLNALGNAFAWQETGAISQFRWNTANDERVCPICGERNYKIFPLTFIEDNMPAHPRCRCWATPIVDLDALHERYSNFDIIPGETFT